MSLQHVAHHLKTKGRGPDTELVHMTKREVAGLQALAQAQGKSLTINPHTGLPEAGILSAILPAVTTAAATYFGGPQAGAYVAAAWGVKTYMDTGSLTKGLITGIGAYGGSQLAAGMTAEMGTSALGQTSGAATSGSQAALADAGTTTAASNTANSATALTNTGSSATGAGTTGASAVDAGMSNTGWYDAGLGSTGAGTTTNPNLLSSTSEGVVDTATKTSEAGGTSGETAKDVSAAKNAGENKLDITKMRMPNSSNTEDPQNQYSYKLPTPKPVNPYAGGMQAEPVPESSIPGSGVTDYRLSKGVDYSLKPVSAEPTGIQRLPNASPQGQPPVDNWKQFQKNATMKNVGMAMAPMMIQDKKAAAPTIKGDTDMGQRYAYQPGYDPKTGKYTTRDSYVPVTSSEAKALYGFADGGEVGSPGNTAADNAAKVQAHQASMNAAQSGAPASSAANAPAFGAMNNYTGYDSSSGATSGAGNNYTGYASAPNIQSFTPTSGDTTGIAAVAPTKGYAYDATTGQFTGGGTDANYLGGGVWGLTSAEQAAKDKADAEAKARDAEAALAAGAASGAARGGLMQSYADGGDVQGDPNMMQVKTYDPVVRMAGGGIYNLGGYSDGGRLLKGPGDGVSDSIPATIGSKQPARLADGEFVVPARIVSELGNGSTDAGARQLYKMMDRVQKARSKTTAKGKMAKNTNAAKYLPA